MDSSSKISYSEQSTLNRHSTKSQRDGARVVKSVVVVYTESSFKTESISKRSTFDCIDGKRITCV